VNISPVAPEVRPHPGVDRVVEGREGHQKPHRDDAARHGIAEPRDMRRGLGRGRPLEPLGEADDDRAEDRDQRRHRGQRDRVLDEALVARRQEVLPRADAHLQSSTTGSAKPRRHGNAAEHHRARRPASPSAAAGGIRSNRRRSHGGARAALHPLEHRRSSAKPRRHSASCAAAARSASENQLV
jgi:hypothetical protein